MFKLYNSLSRKKENFKPLKKKKVTMYSCGPTVYAKPHIGNLSAFLAADLLKRYLIYSGYQVNQAMNLTDVDDKTIKGSMQAGVNLETYTQPFIEAFFQDIKALNMQPADYYPKATEFIGSIVDMVKTLLDKNYAYQGDDGSIYYKVKKFKNYGQLVNLKKQKLKSGARVLHDNYDKKEVADFALWKAWSPQDGDVFWETELGKGRPGWHIECSAMSTSLLGPSIDLHTGAIDLKFPHHSNEIAQSEAATGKRFVKYWVHRSYLRMGQEKMSKSLGNVLNLEEIIKQGFSARDFRYLVLTNHYRTPLVFTKTAMKSAKNSLKKFDEFTERLNNLSAAKSDFDLRKYLDKIKEDFEKYMDDDLNTPRAMAVIFRFIKKINKEIDNKNISQNEGQRIIKFLKEIDQIWGFIFWGHDKKRKLSSEEKELLEKRDQARKKRNFEESDKIRDQLAEKGIEVRDTQEGEQVWQFRG
ncbi:MAG: cysteine--tRNA ligase [Patescibacteria group bacterium]|nr:cysteine--tRNA ligase [Patescibacteria group bacterium]